MIRQVLLGAAIVAGALAPLAGTAHRTPDVDAARLAAMVQAEQDHVTAVELAQWIRGRRPGLRVIDLRTAKEFDELRVPSSVNMPLPELMKAELTRSDTIVLVSAGGGHAAQAWVLMQMRGYRHVYFLRGGVQEWVDGVLRNPGQKELGRYFGGVRSGGC